MCTMPLGSISRGVIVSLFVDIHQLVSCSNQVTDAGTTVIPFGTDGKPAFVIAVSAPVEFIYQIIELISLGICTEDNEFVAADAVYIIFEYFG